MITRRIALALPLVAVAWVAVMAVVMRFSDAAPAAVVVLPTPGFMAALPELPILARGSLSVTFAAEGSDVAQRLYAAGAWLVLPAGLTGCLPLPREAKAGAL